MMNSSNANPARAPSSSLACERCKRRKIKCDRTLPICQGCQKTSEQCLYPSTSHKPGPKPGVRQRHRKSIASLAVDQQRAACDTTAIDHHEHESRSPPVPTEESLRGFDRAVSRGIALSQLIHPSHEPVLQNVPSQTADHPHTSRFTNIHHSLSISSNEYQILVQAYFDNTTAFSLFHRPTFEDKIASIPNPLHAQALLSSVFALSQRYISVTNLSSHDWNHRARRLVDECLKGCEDDVPPLSLLQAMILTTFQELINGVRGRAWRSVGLLVRLAYEMQLHLIDKSPQHNQATATNDEEKRRAWWVIWEFDVFACTIRRLPLSIDWYQNETWLPIEDEIWFANACSKSCILDPDPVVAWKSLQACGNRSPKAWFLVVNALMRAAHILSYPQSYASRDTPADIRARLEVLANSLFCLTAAIPSEDTYDGEFLTFSTCPENRTSFQLDGARHSIHIMIQLSRFMIHHYQVFDNTSRRLLLGEVATVSQQNAIDEAAWTHYLGAASEVVRLIRSCAPKHVYYVNPFLASTVWLAAAAQIVSRVFTSSTATRRVASSNLDVLQTNMNAFVGVWGVSKNLQQKLSSLEARLAVSPEQGNEDGARQVSQAPGRGFRVPSSDSADTTVQGHTLPQSNDTNSSIPPDSSQLWSAPTMFDWTNAPIDAEIGSSLWGWGVDELLQYGVT